MSAAGSPLSSPRRMGRPDLSSDGRAGRAARRNRQVAPLQRRVRVFSTSARDAWLVAGAAFYAVALATMLVTTASGGSLGWAAWALSTVGLAVGLVWTSNTVSHVHLHTPVFVSATANRVFSLFLTVVLGIPQSGWKRRHLHHHGLLRLEVGGTRSGRGERIEVAALLGAWIAAAMLAPAAFFGAVLPVWLLGLGLCALQGHYEHVDGSAAGVDHHGRLYNRLWFNDGHHRHHHRDPSAHWTTLATILEPLAVPPESRVSPWPPLLRWLDAPSPRLQSLNGWARTLIPTALDRLERTALRSRAARRLLLATHAPALAALVKEMGEPAPRRICVVGGGLFPRTAILLGRLLPEADLVIVDADASHLRAAAPELEREQAREARHGIPRSGRTTLVLGLCDGDSVSSAPASGTVPAAAPTWPVPAMDGRPFDLVVVPLALRGDRARFYVPRAGRHVLVHDWIWRRRGDAGRVVSPLLLKRVNLVQARPLAAAKPMLKEPAADPFPCTLRVASAVEARAELPCRTTAPTTLAPPPPREPVSSTTRPSPAFERVIARLS